MQPGKYRGDKRFLFEVGPYQTNYKLPFGTPQDGYDFLSVYTKSSLQEQTTPLSIEVIDVCRNVPTLENATLMIEEGLHILDFSQVYNLVMTHIRKITEDGLRLIWTPLRYAPLWIMITTLDIGRGLTNVDVTYLATALGGSDCQRGDQSQIIKSCRNLTYDLTDCGPLPVGGLYQYRLFVLMKDDELPGFLPEAAFIDFFIASVVFDYGPTMVFRNISSIGLQYIPSHDGFQWIYIASHEYGEAEFIDGLTSQQKVEQVKRILYPHGGPRCRKVKQQIKAKIARLEFLYDCNFRLGGRYRIFILVEDNQNRNDGTLKTIDFTYFGEMTLDSAVPFSMPVPASALWRVVAASSVTSEWRIRYMRFYEDMKCTIPVATFPASYRDPFSTVLSEDERLPNGEAFSMPGPLPTATRPIVSAEDDDGMAWTSGQPCDPGNCHIGFSFGNALDGPGLEHVPVKVGCVEVDQSDNFGEFSDMLELQYFNFTHEDGYEGYVTYRTVSELQGGKAFVPSFNGSIQMHRVPDD